MNFMEGTWWVPQEDSVMDDLTKKRAEFAAETQFQDLPGEVTQETKRLLLHLIGCAMGASQMERGRICAAFFQNTLRSSFFCSEKF
jgi:2-methylcitrate dehydratase PrpD